VSRGRIRFFGLESDEEMGGMSRSDGDSQRERAEFSGQLSVEASSSGKPADMLVARWREVELTGTYDEGASDLRE
jgi:hypothetical protein